MAASTGYDYGIRSGLASKGVDNSKIGYNNATGSVTVNGADFMKADKNYAGTTYTNQQNFNTAWDAYSKSQQQPVAGATPAVGTPNTTPSAPYNPYSSTTSQNPYTSQTDDIIKQLLDYGKNQSNFDPYSTSSYKAAEAAAGRSAQSNVRSAQEAYGGAGMGRSYGLGERAQGIQNDATEYLMTQVLPQIEAQEASRKQQEYNNLLAALNPLMGQQGRADNLVQQDFNNNITTAELTGNYKPQGADQLISQLLALKGQAETKGITAADRNMLSGQADTLRSQLQAMGLDTTALGANVNRSNAASAGTNIGTRTLGGQQLDESVRQYDQNFDRDVLESDRNYNEGVRQYDTSLKYTQGRDAVADQQWQTEFERIKKQDGIKNALDWANQTLNQAEFDDSSAYKWAGLDADLAAAANQGEKYTGMSANDVVSNVRKNFEDEDGALPTDPAIREQMYMQIISAGMPTNQEDQALSAIGFTPEQLKTLDAKYLDSGK